MSETEAKKSEAPINALTLFQVDTSAEDKGVPITYGTTTIWVRSLSAPDIQAIYDRQRRDQSKIRQANGGTLPPAIVEMNDIQIVSALVTDWSGLPDPENPTQELPYSPDAAKRLFARRDLRNLRAALYAEAISAENFRKANLEQVEGNSVQSSRPGSNAATAPT